MKPHAMRYSYCDEKENIWLGKVSYLPSFAPHCQPDLTGSPYDAILKLPSYQKDGSTISSYDICANEMICPRSISVHEFSALQGILSGHSNRWISIATELVSSNINFSTEAVVTLVSHCSLRLGPSDFTETGNKNGLCHRLLEDSRISSKIVDTLSHRLDNIYESWREIHLMSLIITFLIRIHELNPKTPGVKIILEKARSITKRWFHILSKETSSPDPIVAKQCQHYILYAALLCKQTFMSFASDDSQFSASELIILVEASLKIQSNLPKPEKMPCSLKRAVIKDLQLMFKFREQLFASIKNSPASLLHGFASEWHESGAEKTRQLIAFELNESEYSITMDISDQGETYSNIQAHYFMFTGVLLVNGKRQGPLPTDANNSLILQEIFGSIVLQKYPSTQPGMTYQLCIQEKQWSFHIGHEGRSIIIRAYSAGKILEYVQREVFRCDLPGTLLQNYDHWLDLRQKRLEIYPRGQAGRLTVNPSWTLCLFGRTYLRNPKGSRIVDPHSDTFKLISKVLEPFESPEFIQVEQPPPRENRSRAALVALIPRMGLRFRVNSKRRLQASQLEAEVDPDQDAGTWYGLKSKLVLRSITVSQNPTTDPRRIILVPLGELSYKKEGGHVISTMAHMTGDFGKFSINKILGRLECAAEPRLVYTKALLHAVTSGPLPDPLTGRTGVEEALDWLHSPLCQPWIPILGTPLRLVQEIAKLTPQRQFYPPDGGRRLKIDKWNHELTTIVQNDKFRLITDQILALNKNLCCFEIDKSSEPLEIPEMKGSVELNLRSHVQRKKFCRLASSTSTNEIIADNAYISRHTLHTNLPRRYHVQEIADMISKWSTEIPAINNLRQKLAGDGKICGFEENFNMPTLSQRLDTDLRSSWGPLTRFASECGPERKYELMFLLCEIGFHPQADLYLIKSIYAFAVIQELKAMEVPFSTEFIGYHPDEQCTEDFILSILEKYKIEPPKHVAEQFGQLLSNKQRTQIRQAYEQHEKKALLQCKYIASCLQKQWKLFNLPSIDEFPQNQLVDFDQAMEAVRKEWTRLKENYILDQYLQQSQKIMHIHTKQNLPKYQPVQPVNGPVIITPAIFPVNYNTLRDLTQKPMPIELHHYINFPCVGKDHKAVSEKKQSTNIEANELRTIIQPLKSSISRVRQEYANDLLESLNAFSSNIMAKNEEVPTKISVLRAAESARNKVHHLFRAIKDQIISQELSMPGTGFGWILQGGLEPPITPVTLLELLRTSSKIKYGKGVKELLVNYGIAITEYQQQLRLIDALLARFHFHQFGDDCPIIRNEILNPGHVKWDPMKYPDWLLLEIESNLTIRPTQVDVALATISPKTSSNSVLQMNMGEGMQNTLIQFRLIFFYSPFFFLVYINMLTANSGKTSCIIPMSALVLADGENIVRVSVPKALLRQTGNLLQQILGGLPGREIRHVPFSRKTPRDKDTIKIFHSLHQDLRERAGIMLCLPEHQLSFMLSGFQCLVDQKIDQGSRMIKIQSWITENARDIIDESDYILGVRTQLVYPSGSFVTVDGHPHRWLAIQKILLAVRTHLHNLKKIYPHSIDIIERECGGYPFIYFLRLDAEEELIARIVEDICKGNHGVLPASDLPAVSIQYIKEFISARLVSRKTVEYIKRLCPNKPSIKQQIYHLRGLFVNRILILGLKKRWNVKYGLHPKRHPIAVPFHAKGVPSDTSEWGHPDVAIIFTTLAFYYSGLTREQLRQALEHLFKSDDPATEYDRWMQFDSPVPFPESLADWNSINLDDKFQMGHLHQVLVYNVGTIDYFLNNFVFPLYSKQFRIKLQASGWDLPIFLPNYSQIYESNPTGIRHITTGFSGTNDNRHMLPLTIKQQDLPSLSHTNAEVLTYLLQRRSRGYVLLANEDNQRLSEIDLLKRLTRWDQNGRDSIKILIDAGAQILEMDNETLAKEWLDLDRKALAALFFDNANRAWILTRSGAKTPLLASSFADDLDQVLVYLDQVRSLEI